MVSNNRVNNKKNKKEKKEKDCKDLEERCDIVKEVLDKLLEVNLVALDEKEEYYSGFEGIQDFLKILEEYKKTVILSGFSGVIKLPELKRNIEYILPMRKFIAHGVRLVTDNPKDYVVE
jgi:hypothetical protein